MASTSSQNWRVLNKDGTLNIHRAGSSRIESNPIADTYHLLLSLSWPRFFGFIVISFIAVNVLFAVLYFFLGPDAVHGISTGPGAARFSDCFFFSVQTLATVGYGTVAPVDLLANSIVTVEAFLGLLCLALTTGLFYARFSHPTARVLFSSNALITTHNGKPVFLFRVANARLNQIVEARAGATFIRNEVTKEGQRFRRLYDLKLQRDYSPMFALTWLIIHTIDEQSPMFGVSAKDLEEWQVEIVVILTGMDETMAQPVHTRSSYIAEEVLFGGQFKDMLSRNDQGQVQIDLKAIDAVV